MAGFDVSGNRLHVSGALDANAEPQLRAGLTKLVDSGSEIVTVDLSAVEAITSVCIGALVVLWIDLGSTNRRATLVASPVVKKVLDMTGLTSVLMNETA